MDIRKVTSKRLLVACRSFLAKDPVANVLLLGDVCKPLFSICTVYGAVDSGNIVGVCAVYRAFSTPSLVFGGISVHVKQALMEQALHKIEGDFISLCKPEEVSLFKEHATLQRSYFEHQMTTSSPRSISFGSVRAVHVGKNELEQLDRFYVEHHAGAWAPIQFEAGPYYCLKQGDRIVSAAGVQVVTSRIAQIGNIVTDEAFRNRGFATACTTALAMELAAKGRIVSLFVRVDNSTAIRMYERLGFARARDIAFLVMRRNAIKEP